MVDSAFGTGYDLVAIYSYTLFATYDIQGIDATVLFSAKSL